MLLLHLPLEILDFTGFITPAVIVLKNRVREKI
nr:MAG TPA: hypothetical protein [Bacteriophage sp.]